MIKEFKVKGFKGFKDYLELDLSSGNFEFNDEAIKDGVVKTSVIYGENGSGKSNLGLAIMDVATHLTDADFDEKEYTPYINLDSDLDYAEFEYVFKFGQDNVRYKYRKHDFKEVSDEYLCINDQPMIISNESLKQVNLKGGENLNIDSLRDDISFVKLVNANANFVETDKIASVFKKFMLFINKMLSFDSVLGHHYQGYTIGISSITQEIINRDKVKEYESFLKEMGIKYNLFLKEIDGKKQIYVRFSSGNETNIHNIWSKGTNALTLFYNWYIQFEEGVKFVFIDEFDAYFHHTVSVNIIKKLVASKKIQAVITTHNTVNISSELLRPDCYFNLEEDKIDSFASIRGREIRKAQNMEKMFRAGAFDFE